MRSSQNGRRGRSCKAKSLLLAIVTFGLPLQLWASSLAAAQTKVVTPKGSSNDSANSNMGGVNAPRTSTSSGTATSGDEQHKTEWDNLYHRLLQTQKAWISVEKEFKTKIMTPEMSAIRRAKLVPVQDLIRDISLELAKLAPNEHHSLLSELYALYLTSADDREWVLATLESLEAPLEITNELYRAESRGEMEALGALVNTLTIASVGSLAHFGIDYTRNRIRPTSKPVLGSPSTALVIQKSPLRSRLSAAVRNPRTISLWGAAAAAGAGYEYLIARPIREKNAKVSPLDGLKIVQIQMACEFAWSFKSLLNSCEERPENCEKESDLMVSLEKIASKTQLLLYDYSALEGVFRSEAAISYLQGRNSPAALDALAKQMSEKLIPEGVVGGFKKMNRMDPASLKLIPQCKKLALGNDLMRSAMVAEAADRNANEGRGTTPPSTGRGAANLGR